MAGRLPDPLHPSQLWDLHLPQQLGCEVSCSSTHAASDRVCLHRKQRPLVRRSMNPLLLRRWLSRCLPLKIGFHWVRSEAWLLVAWSSSFEGHEAKGQRVLLGGEAHCVWAGAEAQ